MSAPNQYTAYVLGDEVVLIDSSDRSAPPLVARLESKSLAEVEWNAFHHARRFDADIRHVARLLDLPVATVLGKLERMFRVHADRELRVVEIGNVDAGMRFYALATIRVAAADSSSVEVLRAGMAELDDVRAQSRLGAPHPPLDVGERVDDDLNFASWVAVDRIGSVGLFEASGTAAIPATWCSRAVLSRAGRNRAAALLAPAGMRPPGWRWARPANFASEARANGVMVLETSAEALAETLLKGGARRLAVAGGDGIGLVWDGREADLAAMEAAARHPLARWSLAWPRRVTAPYLELARRGVYVYRDTLPYHATAPYAKVVQPSVPLHVDALPRRERQLLWQTRLDVEFEKADVVQPARHTACWGGFDRAIDTDGVGSFARSFVTKLGPALDIGTARPALSFRVGLAGEFHTLSGWLFRELQAEVDRIVSCLTREELAWDLGDGLGRSTDRLPIQLHLDVVGDTSDPGVQAQLWAARHYGASQDLPVGVHWSDD